MISLSKTRDDVEQKVNAIDYEISCIHFSGTKKDKDKERRLYALTGQSNALRWVLGLRVI